MKFNSPSFYLTLGCFLLVGCGVEPNVEIETTVSRFYLTYDGDFRKVDRTMISTRLATMIDQAIQKEESEAQKVKESEFPNDKPILIEGDIFTSFFEGSDAIVVEKISVLEQVAEVKVLFENSAYNQSRSDRIILVWENDRWKIENVVYNGSQEAADLQTTLKNLIEYEGGIDRLELIYGYPQ
jgi:hypothetical protein